MSSDDLAARIEALEAQGYEFTELMNFMEPTGPRDAFVVFRELLTALEQAQARLEGADAAKEAWQAIALHYQTAERKAQAIGRVRLALAEERAEHWHEGMLLLADDCKKWEQRTEQAEADAWQQLHRAERAESALEQAQERLEQANKNTEGLADYIRECATEYQKVHTIGRVRLALAEQRNTDLRREIDELYANDDLNAKQAEDDLAAERAKRCATCDSWGIVSWSTLGEKYGCTSAVMSTAGSGGEYAFDPAEDDFSCSEWQPREEAGS